MRKLFLFLLLIIICSLSYICVAKTMTIQATLANPWVECRNSFELAEKVAGFGFPLQLSNYNIRAMRDMIEIVYPLDSYRNVTVRKSNKPLRGDISGVYTRYPKNKEIKLSNGVPVRIKGIKDRFFVMNMSAHTGYYSAYCKEGLSKDELEKIYELIRIAEDKFLSKEAVVNKYSFCELGDLVGEDVKKIKYDNYNLDYHSKDFTKKQIKAMADRCLAEGVANQKEMDCCLTEKMYPEKK